MAGAALKRPIILELPPGLTLEQLQTILNDRLRDLNAVLKEYVIAPADQSLDLGTQRIVNLADPKDDLDGVNLRTLQRFKPIETPTKSTPGTPLRPGILDFAVRAEGYGALTIEALTSPAVGAQAQLTALWLDETDIEWFGTGSIDSTTDPVTFTPVTTRASRFGQSVGTVTVADGGSGFTSIPRVEFIGDGAGAEAVATISGGRVTGIQVRKHGGGYNTLTVRITGGGGSGALLSYSFFPFAPGQLVAWNNPTIVGANSVWPLRHYSYEIDLIKSINYATGEMTFERGDPAYPGKAKYGSPKEAHSNKDFYLLVQSQLPTRTLSSEIQPQRWKSLLDNATVAVVLGRFLGGGATTTKLLLPLPGGVPDSPNTRCPGLRTMSGNAYINLVFSGPLTVGQNIDARRVDAGQSYETFRCAVGKLAIAGSSGGPTIARMCYVNREGAVGLVDNVIVPDGANDNESPTRPIERQMPYHLGYGTAGPHQYDYPPNRFVRCMTVDPMTMLNVPLVLGPNDDLPSGMTFDATHEGVAFEPNGDLMGVMDQVGTDADTLRVTIQT